MKRFLNGFAATATALLIVVVGTTIAGARFNVSASFPMGLYWTRHVVPGKNDLVYFRPPRTDVFELARARDYIDPSALGAYQPLIRRSWQRRGIRSQSRMRAL
jgi:type IV secretory pathway protease TraF